MKGLSSRTRLRTVLHYFHRGGDWYIVERDSSDEQRQAFGAAGSGGAGAAGAVRRTSDAGQVQPTSALSRQVFLARIATGGWRYILVSHELLRDIVLSQESFDRFLAREPIFEQPFLMDFSDVAQPQAEAVTQPTVKHKTADRYVEVLRATTGAGTPDAYAITVNEQGIKLRVGDLKTGVGQAAGLLPPPERSWQLLSYVLAVLAKHNWPASGAQINSPSSTRPR